MKQKLTQRQEKIQKFLYMLKPTGYYLFCLVISNYLYLGGVIIRDLVIENQSPIALWGFGAAYLLLYSLLGYLVLTKRQINTYTLVAYIVLFFVPIIGSDGVNLSLFVFIAGFILQIVNIANNVDLERIIVEKLIKMRKKK